MAPCACAARYFLCRIDPGQIHAEELLAHVLNHGQIENSGFFLKDRWWDEDRHRTRRPGLSEWLAHPTIAATIPLRLFRSESHQPLRAQADEIQRNPQTRLPILYRS
jgi:hypothetical protein